jgi:hypothetical protein
MNEVTQAPEQAVSGSGLTIDVAQPDAPISTLAPVGRAALALKSAQTQIDLQELAAKHTGLVEIKNKAGRDQVHGAAMELMRARTAIKKVADEVRDDAKRFNAAVIAEEKRLTAIVEPEETRLKALRDAWDAEQERIKREAEEKERARVLALGARIQEIRGFVALARDCRTSDAVRRILERVKETSLEGFDEFEEEARKVHAETLAAVGQVLDTRLATEAEAARLKAEREELERQQAEAKRQADELAAQQKAEADRLAAERAELERMRAEIEAAKVAAAAPIQPAQEPADVVMADTQEVANALGITLDVGNDADLVDTATTTVPSASTEGIPSAEWLIGVIASHYGTDAETACQWLCARADDFEAWVPSVADIA